MFVPIKRLLDSLIIELWMIKFYPSDWKEASDFPINHQHCENNNIFREKLKAICMKKII
jgi:hypothetical protein